MNGSDLMLLARQSCQLRNHFRGVFARDTFVSLPGDVTGAFIVNQSDRGSPGTHWVSIFIQRNREDGRRHCIFFDPLGRGGLQHYKMSIPTKEGSTRPHPVIYNTRRFQQETSDSCGLFCLYVLHWLAVGVRFQCILQHFSTEHLVKNENKIRDFSTNLKNGLLMC